MACLVVVELEDGVGRPFGPFVTRDEAEAWVSETAEFQEEHTVSFFDMDDFIAFGAEVN